MSRAWFPRLARDRLAQFVALGGALFVLAPGPRNGHDVSFSSEQLDALHGAQARRLGKARLTEDEARTVDERAMQDEVLYREGLRLGFAESDDVVRQRVIQKALFLAEELGGAAHLPSEDELRRFYDQTRAEWRRAGERAAGARLLLCRSRGRRSPRSATRGARRRRLRRTSRRTPATRSR